jgi:hypothetical protein
MRNMFREDSLMMNEADAAGKGKLVELLGALVSFEFSPELEPSGNIFAIETSDERMSHVHACSNSRSSDNSAEVYSTGLFDQVNLRPRFGSLFP